MRELDYYGRITNYYLLASQALGKSITWEAKLTKGKSLPFSDLKPHQEQKLLESERAYGAKIPDIGLSQKPFDGYVIWHAFAVVVVIFYEPRNERVYEISIRNFIEERELGLRKSLTEERAEIIGRKIPLKK